MNAQIERIRIKTETRHGFNVGEYLKGDDGQRLTFFDMDGELAKQWLESQGYTVIKNYDDSSNGLAVTSCGIALSTNGYCYKIKDSDAAAE